MGLLPCAIRKVSSSPVTRTCCWVRSLCPISAESAEIGFWMSKEQFEYWKHTYLLVDAVPGRGGGFSIESPTGLRFLIRSRLMDQS